MRLRTIRRKYLCLLAFFLLYCIHALAVLPIDADEFRKNVVFIYPPTLSGNVDTTHFASGFIVGVPFKGNPNRRYVFLITARHVIDPEWLACGYQTDPDKIFIRVNVKKYDLKTTDKGVAFLPIALRKAGRRLWFSHQDQNVDLAIIPIAADSRIPIDGKDWDLHDYDVLALPFNAFPADSELSQLTIGASVFTAGLVPELASAKRNYPTFKFGRISNIFDEPVLIPCSIRLRPPKAISIWGIAANFAPGNSGSPILVFPIDIVPKNGILVSGFRPFVAGIVSCVVGADFS